MITSDEEIIPAADVLRSAGQKEGLTLYFEYLQTLKDQNVPRAEEYLQKMVMLDYLIMNEDRHFNNFGVIRNVQTLKWKRICPIYDTGRSMNTTLSRDYWTFNDDEAEVKFFSRNYILCSCLADIFAAPVSRKQLLSLRELAAPYRRLLEKNADPDRVNREMRDTLVSGWLSRVDQFEKALEKKRLIIE